LSPRQFPRSLPSLRSLASLLCLLSISCFFFSLFYLFYLFYLRYFSIYPAIYLTEPDPTWSYLIYPWTYPSTPIYLVLSIYEPIYLRTYLWSCLSI
jgi:hypothetical protein